MMKLLAGTVAGGAAIGFYAYYRSLRRLQKNMEVVIKAAVQSVKTEGITIKIDALIKNPTDGEIRMRFPHIRLKFNGETAGSSQVINRDIFFKAYSESKIENILIFIPAYGLAVAAVKAVKDVKEKKAVTITIETSSTIYAGPSKIPYTDSQDITIRLKK
jgi:hypothetical protein